MQNIKFNKKEMELKMKNPIERRILCFSLYKNRKLKVKRKRKEKKNKKRRKKQAFFNICVLSQRIISWIHFQNIHTLTYEKILINTIFCWFLKSSKALCVSLMRGLRNSDFHFHASYGTKPALDPAEIL